MKKKLLQKITNLNHKLVLGIEQGAISIDTGESASIRLKLGVDQLLSNIPGATTLLGTLGPEIVEYFPKIFVSYSVSVKKPKGIVPELIAENKCDIKGAKVYRFKIYSDDFIYLILIPGIGLYQGDIMRTKSGDYIPNGIGSILFCEKIRESNGWGGIHAKFINGEIKKPNHILWFKYCGGINYFGEYKRKELAKLQLGGKNWYLWMPHGQGALSVNSVEEYFFSGKFRNGGPVRALYFQTTEYLYKGSVEGLPFRTSPSDAYLFSIRPNGKGHLKEKNDTFEIIGDFHSGFPVFEEAVFINTDGLYETEFWGLFPTGTGNLRTTEKLSFRNKKSRQENSRYILGKQFLIVKKNAKYPSLSGLSWGFLKISYKVRKLFSRRMGWGSINIYDKQIPFSFVGYRKSSAFYQIWKRMGFNPLSTMHEVKINGGIPTVTRTVLKSPFKKAVYTEMQSGSRNKKQLIIKPGIKKYKVNQLIYEGDFNGIDPINWKCNLKIDDKGVFNGSYDGLIPLKGEFNYSMESGVEIKFIGIFKNFVPFHGTYIIRQELLSSNGIVKHPIIVYDGEMADFRPNGHGELSVYGTSQNPSLLIGEYKGEFLEGQILSKKISTGSQIMVTSKVLDLMENFNSLEKFSINGVGKYYGQYDRFLPHGMGIIRLEINYKSKFRWFVGRVEQARITNDGLFYP